MFILDKVPTRKKDFFAWADYLEFRCVTNIDNQISTADLSNFVETAEDFNEDSDILGENSLVAERDDELEAYISRYMGFLRSRKMLFGENYPFELMENGIFLKENLTPPQIGYIILLFSSCLKNININHREILTTSFENVTAAYFQNLLSSHGCAHVISSKNKNIGTTALQRIEWVASQLGSSVICDKTAFAGNTAGEKGLDVIAWLDVGDTLNNKPIFLIQATCGDSISFELKTAQVSPAKWRKIIKFDNRPIEVLSIPHSYRKQNNLFEDELMYGNALLIDRSRILNRVANFNDILNDAYDRIHNMIFGDAQTTC